MSNFIVLVDPDRARRDAFCHCVRPLIAPLPHLEQHELGALDCAVVWAAGARAPVDSFQDDDGLAVVWGRAVPADDSHPISAATVASAWRNVVDTSPTPWDGYYAAVAYHRDHGLTIGGDILGYFPIYWWSTGEVTLVGSSPELFRRHPKFNVALDPVGLAGILLVMHSVAGRTLLKGVRRLAYGHLLHAPRDGTPSEYLKYQMPYSTEYYDWPFAEHLNLLDDALSHCMRRQLPPGTNGMLLSGGLDSRVLSGFLARQGAPAKALTFGVESDFEANCARRVAKALRFDHRVVEVDLDPAIECAERHARWLQLNTGFSGIEYWNARPYLDALPPYFVSGYALDTAMAAGYTGRSYSPETRTMSWDNYSKHVLAWGVGVERLRRLLREEVFGEALDETLDRLRTTYDGYSEYPSKRHWMFGMLHRMRFHVAQTPWIFSHASWPILPLLDQALLKTIGGLPPATVGQRRAQVELVATRFPVLARLPLDRNSYNRVPITAGWKDLLKDRLEYRWRTSTTKLPLPRHERRYYHRVYSLDSRGWRTIREHAAPHVRELECLLHGDVLHEYVPAPQTAIPTTDVFADSSGRKVLLGLALWARDYL